MQETNSTCPQASTQTSESDTKTTERQSNPVTISLPTANKHYCWWLIPITINQVSTLALLDTGVTCAMIGQPLYETLQATQPLKVKQDEDLRLEVIGGGAAPTLDTVTVQIGLVGGSYEHEIVISTNRENLTASWAPTFSPSMTVSCRCTDKSSRLEAEVWCVPDPMHAVKAGLKTARRVELPARTEVIVPCKPTHASGWLQRNAAVTQSCSNQWHYTEDGIVIGSTLKPPDQTKTVIPVMNLTHELT